MPKPENIVPHKFKKGQSGNPKGRPKLPDIREALEKVMGEEKDGLTALDAVLMALRKKATSGDVRAAEVLLDRAFGKAVQKNANTDSQGNDVTHTVTIIKPK